MYISSDGGKTVAKITADGLEFSVDNGEVWKPLGYQPDDTIDCIRYATTIVDSDGRIRKIDRDYLDYEKFKRDYLGEFKEEKIMDILGIYKGRKMKAIDQAYEEKRESLENNNEIINRYKEITNTFKASMDEFVNEEKVKASGLINSTPYLDNYRYELNQSKVNELFVEIDKERHDKFAELERLIEEVNAMINIVPKDGNYDAKVVEILKSYEILDKKGKINA